MKQFIKLGYEILLVLGAALFSTRTKKKKKLFGRSFSQKRRKKQTFENWFQSARFFRIIQLSMFELQKRKFWKTLTTMCMCITC